MMIEAYWTRRLKPEVNNYSVVRVTGIHILIHDQSDTMLLPHQPRISFFSWHIQKSSPISTFLLPNSFTNRLQNESRKQVCHQQHLRRWSCETSSSFACQPRYSCLSGILQTTIFVTTTSNVVLLLLLFFCVGYSTICFVFLAYKCSVSLGVL